MKGGGYIVICAGRVMRVYHEPGRTPDGGVLLAAQSGTIFKTRGRARRAVERSKSYARAQGLPWPILDGTKVKVVPVRLGD